MEKVKKFLIETIKTVATAAILAIIITKFIAMGVQVVGTSMLPNLNPKDAGVSFPMAKYFGIDRFDIVVIDKGEEQLIVKRVIGLPGETIKYENDLLYINGEHIEENFAHGSGIVDFEYILADDEYFVIGDNREVSLDSRYTGPYKLEDIKSVGVFVIYPFNNFGLKK